MKQFLALAVVAVAFCAAGEEEYISPITGKPVPNDGKFALEQYKERDERVLKKTGGFIDVEARGVSVAVLDGRQKPGGAAMQFADVFGSLSKTNVKAERAPLGAGTNAVDAALSFLKEQNAAYAIAIVEDAALRGLTVMPEDRIAVINATRFKDDGSDVLKPEVRIHKEIWRALGFVSGIGYAPYPNDVLQPVFSVQALDGLEYQVMQPMNFQKMYSTLLKFGVKRNRRVPYHVAVKEGWAPAPTNDVQKAIWDKVHAMPTEPIKIKPEEKKTEK